MSGVEFDYPITSTRHLRSGDGIIPLLDGGLAEREKFSQNLVLAIGGSLLALVTACQGSRPPEPSPSSVPQAIIIPVSIGSSLPENCLTDSLAQRGFDRAAEDQQTRQTGRVVGEGLLTPADNDAIGALNTCAASAKATVEAPSPTAKVSPTSTAKSPEPTPTSTPEKNPENLLTSGGVFPGDLIDAKANRVIGKSVTTTISNNLVIIYIYRGNDGKLAFSVFNGPLTKDSDGTITARQGRTRSVNKLIFDKEGRNLSAVYTDSGNIYHITGQYDDGPGKDKFMKTVQDSSTAAGMTRSREEIVDSLRKAGIILPEGY